MKKNKKLLCASIRLPLRAKLETPRFETCRQKPHHHDAAAQLPLSTQCETFLF